MTGRVGSRVIRSDGDHRGRRSHCEETDLTRQTALRHQGRPHGSLRWAKPMARSTISLAPAIYSKSGARQPRVWAVSGGGGASEPHQFRPPRET
jgi:hypothetical protein